MNNNLYKCPICGGETNHSSQNAVPKRISRRQRVVEQVQGEGGQMTNEDINKAIAEFCGWNQKSSHFGGATGIWTDSSGVDHTRFPDYCKDLNAMHEAEKVLTQIQWSKYRIDLTSICERDDVARLGYTPTHQSFWHATARQRAKAFLRTQN